MVADDSHPPHLPPADVAALAAFGARVRADLGGGLIAMRIFGSKARGDATEESDIDVLVVVNELDRGSSER